MQAVKLDAIAGWRWIAFGYAIFRRNPAMMLSLSMSYWLILLLAGMFPMVGSVLSAVLAPGLSVGIMNACRQIDRGQPVAFNSLFSGFRHNPRALLALGALYFAATIGALALTTLVDDGTLFRLMTGGKLDPDEFSRQDFQYAAQFAMLLMAPVIMAWWYAPMLASWHGTPVAKALFFSLVACWRNWKPFLAYSLAALLLTLPPLFMIGLLASGGGGGMAILLSLPVLLFLAPLFFASFYVSYRDVFVNPDPLDPPAAGNPGIDIHA